MIDVRELRIGAHISVNGERKRIDHIGCNGEVGEVYIFDPKWSKEKQLEERSKHTWNCLQIEPIPITAELLTELGFEKIDNTLMWEWSKARSVIFSCIGNGNWNIRRLVPDEKWQALTVRYLHEAEAFVWLTLHKELIEE